jgi:hypothetical protein
MQPTAIEHDDLRPMQDARRLVVSLVIRQPPVIVGGAIEEHINIEIALPKKPRVGSAAREITLSAPALADQPKTLSTLTLTLA